MNLTWPKPNLLLVAVWLGTGLLISIAAQRIFTKRNAEIAGITGTSSLVGLICTFFPTFFVFSFTLWIGMRLLDEVAAVLLAVVTGLAAYALSELIFKQVPFKNDKKKLIWVSSLCLATIIILQAGGLGFVGRLPAADNVDYVYISYKGTPDYLPSWRSSSRSYYNQYYTQITSVYYHQLEEIEKVQEIHRDFAAYGRRRANPQTFVDHPTEYTVNTVVMISYVLKNGKTLSRFYPAVSAKALTDMLQLDDTPTIMEKIEESLTNSSYFTEGDIFLTDIYYQDDVPFDPDEQTRSELLAALREDILNQSVEERYFPKGPAAGIITFVDNAHGSFYMGEKYDIFEWNVSKIFVTDEFTHTIAFLKETGLWEHFTFTGNIEYLTFEPYTINLEEKDIYYSERSHYFRSFQSGSPRILAAPDPISDPARVQELLPKLRSHYFAVEGGYTVGVHVEGQAPVYVFLPVSDAPPNLGNL